MVYELPQKYSDVQNSLHLTPPLVKSSNYPLQYYGVLFVNQLDALTNLRV